MTSQLPGPDLTVSRLTPEGELTPVSLADQIEDALNEDIRNARVAELFNSVLTLGVGAAQLYQRLPADRVDEYRTLLGLLRGMLEVTAPNA